jgi:hypothetical protein
VIGADQISRQRGICFERGVDSAARLDLADEVI